MTDPNGAVDKRKISRGKVLNELIVTERDYVSDLEIVIKLFIEPLREKEILTKEQLLELFINIEVIYSLNAKVLQDFEARIEQRQSDDAASLASGSAEQHELLVGDILVSFADYFKLYAHYCIKQPSQLACFHELVESHSDFDQLIRKTLCNPKMRFLELTDFLIKPLQRLCKYPLLLKELLAYTDASHPDYANLMLAKEKIQNVVQYVNDRKRSDEKQRQVFEVLSSIDGCKELGSIDRELIKKGEVSMLDGKQLAERVMVLFNDAVIIARPRDDGRATFLQSIAVSKVRIIDVADTDAVKNQFEIGMKDSARRHIVSCATLKEKQLWIKEWKRIIKEHQRAEFMAKQKEWKQEEEKRNALAARQVDRIEVVEGDNTDAWSLGLILYTLFTEKSPFEGLSPDQAVMAFVKRTHSPSLDHLERLSSAHRRLLGACLHPDIAHRPSVAVIHETLRTTALAASEEGGASRAIVDAHRRLSVSVGATGGGSAMPLTGDMAMHGAGDATSSVACHASSSVASDTATTSACADGSDDADAESEKRDGGGETISVRPTTESGSASEGEDGDLAHDPLLVAVHQSSDGECERVPSGDDGGHACGGDAAMPAPPSIEHRTAAGTCDDDASITRASDARPADRLPSAATALHRQLDGDGGGVRSPRKHRCLSTSFATLPSADSASPTAPRSAIASLPLAGPPSSLGHHVVGRASLTHGDQTTSTDRHAAEARGASARDRTPHSSSLDRPAAEWATVTRSGGASTPSLLAAGGGGGGNATLGSGRLKREAVAVVAHASDACEASRESRAEHSLSRRISGLFRKGDARKSLPLRNGPM